jgi:putative nucleotidyltransferase with HDIG domain
MAITEREAVLGELEVLMRDTYQLWDEGWVGFSWRNYTYDHVQRVRRLALSLAAEEGADLHVLDVAAVLHDITKSFDGEVLMRDGQRVVDEQGFWRNEHLPPARTNAITQTYDALGLAGTVHNISGAHIARKLLAERGYDEAFREHVAEIIISHLKVTDATSLEGRCLYDADTIDANIGHPALYRNIQISMHFLERQHAERGESTQEYLARSLRDHVQEYVAQRWPTWVGGKHRDFVERMTTEAGRSRALARIGRLEETLQALQAELDEFDGATENGYLAPIVHFIHSRDNPSLADELDLLHQRWPAHQAHPATDFLSILRRESEGVW